MIPPVLYQLPSSKDWAGGQLAHVCRQVTDSQLSTSFDVELYQVPFDKILALQHARARSIPGAGQIAKFVSCNIIAAQTIVLQTDPPIQHNTADLSITFSLNNPVWVAPGQTLTMSATYDAAVAANSLTASFVGLLIPRGNLQLA